MNGLRYSSFHYRTVFLRRLGGSEALLEWIDRKFLNWPNTLVPDPSVKVVVEPMNQLESLVAAGEGPNIEFKVELPDDTASRRKYRERSPPLPMAKADICFSG